MVTWAVPTNPLRKMAARKKTHGAPDARLYESPEVMALFEPIRMWLSKNCKKVKCLLKTAGHWMSGLSLRGWLRELCSVRGMGDDGHLFFPLLALSMHLQYVQADPPTKKSLAQLTYAMLNFQEVTGSHCTSLHVGWRGRENNRSGQAQTGTAPGTMHLLNIPSSLHHTYWRWLSCINVAIVSAHVFPQLKALWLVALLLNWSM